MIKFLTKIKKCPNEIKNTLSQSLRYLSSKIIDEDEEILRKGKLNTKWNLMDE